MGSKGVEGGRREKEGEEWGRKILSLGGGWRGSGVGP